MSKTIEVWNNEYNYTIASPDHEDVFHVSGYTIDTEEAALMEDGCITVDIDDNKYFHIDVSNDIDHATITTSHEPERDDIIEAIDSLDMYTVEVVEDEYSSFAYRVDLSSERDIDVDGGKVGRELFKVVKNNGMVVTGVSWDSTLINGDCRVWLDKEANL